MLAKPIKGQIKVYRCNHVWRNIWAVEWTDGLNYPRTFSTLFRQVQSLWCVGEANPTGAHNSGLLRFALDEIAAALTKAQLAKL